MTRWVWLVALLLGLSGCGGGGSSGGGSSSSGGNGSGSGAFTLSTNKVVLRASDNGTAPRSQEIMVNVTGGDVARVIAGWPQNSQPTWVGVNLTGSGNSLLLTLVAAGQTSVSPDRTATLIVETQDAAGRQLSARQVEVTLQTFAGLRLANTLFQRQYVFGAIDSESLQLDVTAPGKTWKLTSDKPWARVSAATYSGSTSGPVTIDIASVGPYLSEVAHVEVTNVADPDDRHLANILVDVSGPQMTITPATLTLGGDLGTQPLTSNVTVTLATGSRHYPLSAQVVGLPAAAPLTLTPSAEVGGNSPGTVAIAATGSIAPGIYSGTLSVTAMVQGVPITRSIPLNVNRESQRLFPIPNGVAFNSFPSQSLLTREVTIADSHGRPGVPWLATTSTAWLHVSPAQGVTGDRLTITVDDAALAAGAFHSGMVTLSSSDPAVSGTETIRVGLWKGSSDPQSQQIPFTGIPRALATNPVEPWAYLFTDDTHLRIYNVHTGALLADLVPGVADRSSLAVSSDGLRLYVGDHPARRILEIDATTGALLRSFAMPAGSGPFYDDRGPVMLFTRMSGHPVLFPSFDGANPPVRPIDLESGQALQIYTSTGARNEQYFSYYTTGLYGSADGQYQYASGQSSIDLWHTQFSMMRGPSIVQIPGDAYAGLGNLNGMCVGPEGRVYSIGDAAGVTVRERNLALASPSLIPLPSRPFFMACAADGRKYLFTSPTSSTDPNCLRLDSGNGLSGGLRLGGAAGSGISGRPVLSGDDTRLVYPATSAGVRELRIIPAF